MKKTLILTALFILLQGNALAFWPFGPSTYDECISKEMKGVTSDVAARAIMQSCRKRFSEKEKPSRSVSPSELSSLTGTLSQAYSGNYTGDIYNGLSLTVTSITISLWTYDAAGQILSSRNYKIKKEIAPLTAGNIYISVPSDAKTASFNWGVADATVAR